MKMLSKANRLLAGFLAVLMVTAILPAGIFAAEFNINTKSVHRFGNCIGQLRKVYIKLVHYFVRPLFLPRLRCCSSSRSIT